MPTLSLLEEAGAQDDASIVRVVGTFDIATLPQFETLLRRLRESGRIKIVVDLARLDYISSSGLGAFLGTVDPFRALGGDLIFVRLSERVQKIFKVVGFTRLLTIMADEQDALRSFHPRRPPLNQLILSPATGTPHSGEAFEVEVLAADERGMAFEAFTGEAVLRASTGIVSPAKVGPFKAGVWRGKVVLTGPGVTGLRATCAGDTGAFGEVFLHIQETKQPAVLPFSVACPGCGQSIDISAFNVYRCKACEEVYFVDKWAHAISLKSGKREEAHPPKRFGLSFPADVNLLAAVRAFIVAVLREHGFGPDLVNDLEMAADEAVTNVVEHAYQYDNRKTVFLELSLEKGGVQVKVKDQGQAFNPLQTDPVNLDQHIAERRTGGLGVHLIQSLMDTVDYRREDGFNVLTLTKQGRPA
jgi:serine/threonine-protein kinase RsbW